MAEKLIENSNVRKVDNNEIETAIISAIDIEVSRLTESDIANVTSRLLQLHHSWNLHILTTIEGVTKASTLVFENASFRDFILNTTVRFLINLEMTDEYLNTLVAGIITNTTIIDKSDSDTHITPEVIKESLSKDEELMTSLFLNDKWLITLFYIIQCLNKTIVFSELTANT